MRALVAALACATAPALAQDACVSVVGARLTNPTEAYGHGAVADGEYATLEMDYLVEGAAEMTSRITSSVDVSVFEDTHARVVDLDGDGCNEVVVTKSSQEKGASIAVWGMATTLLPDPDVPRDQQTKTVAMPVPLGISASIGRRHRWLAIAGIADFDGDGVKDIAYIDRPHLAKTLRVLRIQPIGMIKNRPMFELTEMAKLSGLTNHHYSSPLIEGGVRDCGGVPPVIVTADADWQNIVETQMADGKLHSSVVAPYDGADSFQPFLTCPAG